MFAVIKTGGKQYRVVAEDVLRVDRLEGEPGAHLPAASQGLVGPMTPELARQMQAMLADTFRRT